MLIIAGSASIDPAKRDELSAAGREMVAETRKEPGCLAYAFSWDFDDPNVIHIYERWESQEALDAHFASPHMAKFQVALGKLGPSGLEIRKYEIASEGPVR